MPTHPIRSALRAAAAAAIACAAGAAGAETRDLAVVPARVPAARQPVAASIMPVGPAAVRLGEPIRFRAVSTRSGFGSLYVASASGRVQVWAENLPVRAGRPVEIPNRGFTIVAAPPAGDERIVFLATRERFAGFHGGATVPRPADLQVSRDGLSAGLQDRLAGLPRGSWASAEVVVRVTE